MTEIQPIRRLSEIAAENEAAQQRMRAHCLVAESLLRRAERLQTPAPQLLVRVASLYVLAQQADPKAVRPLLGLAHLECLWGSEERAFHWLEQARQLQPRHHDVLKRWALLKKQLQKNAFVRKSNHA